MYLTTKNWHWVHSFVRSGNHSFAPPGAQFAAADFLEECDYSATTTKGI
jgi:hypothetical protein